MYRKIGARDKRTAFYPGSDHGWSLVESSRSATQIWDLVLGWIERRT